MIKIALTNLGKYNEGELVYEWLNLPASEDEIQSVMERIGIGSKRWDGGVYEEYFISDYEFDGDISFEIYEFTNINRLNEIAEYLEELDDEQIYAIQAYIEAISDDIEEAIEFANSDDYIIIHDCDDMTDVAYYYVDEVGIFGDLPEEALRYFDYESFGRDLQFDRSFVFLDGSVCVEIID